LRKQGPHSVFVAASARLSGAMPCRSCRRHHDF